MDLPHFLKEVLPVQRWGGGERLDHHLYSHSSHIKRLKGSVPVERPGPHLPRGGQS